MSWEATYAVCILYTKRNMYKIYMHIGKGPLKIQQSVIDTVMCM